MIRAYDNSYLPGMMNQLGVMYDYGVQALGFTMTEIHSRFLSQIAPFIEMAHPKYLAGLSGCDFALMITGSEINTEYVADGRSPEYWSGWALAYLQWYSAYTFIQIERALSVSEILSMYNPYHEADISKFVEVALSIIERKMSEGRPSRLKEIRKSSGITQKELSEMSGISLRTIRSYEQSSRSMDRAEFGRLKMLSQCLRCKISDLL
ncbi:MAG: helix-turn-helix domain-containing protein [Candidatus Cryptobacteroides sp.]